jgi:hypothetical protein
MSSPERESPVAEPPSTVALSDTSALHSNIKTKGQNSYYYAHKKREDVEIHEWDGNAQPRLLKKQHVQAATAAPEPTEAITNYAWADGKKRVSLYVTLPGIGEHAEDKTLVDWTATSVTLKVESFEGKTRVLSIPKLQDEIMDVKTKRKQDQLVLQLAKAKELTWYNLKKDS